MRILFAFLFLSLLAIAGCAHLTKADYPQTCDIREPDKDGSGGYTKGTFPCRLEHHAGQKPPPETPP